MYVVCIDDDDDDDDSDVMIYNILEYDDNIWVLSMYVCVYRYKYVCLHDQFLSPY